MRAVPKGAFSSLRTPRALYRQPGWASVLAGLASTLLVSACALAATLSPPWPANSVSTHKPLIIAHRGASGTLPEHTLQAYALAIEQVGREAVLVAWE